MIRALESNKLTEIADKIKANLIIEINLELNTKGISKSGLWRIGKDEYFKYKLQKYFKDGISVGFYNTEETLVQALISKQI